MTIKEIANAVADKYGKYGVDVFDGDEPEVCERKNEAYEDDANIHIHFNGLWMWIGYDQMTAPQKYLDRATAYAQKLVSEASK